MRTGLVDIRARTREAVREELATRAMDVFDDRGFDHATVDDIAAAAGISARTFYRYFPSKEDVVLGDSAASGEELSSILADHLLRVTPWSALHLTFRRVAEYVQAEPSRWLRSARVVSSSESLRARSFERYLTWGDILGRTIVGPVHDRPPVDALRANVLVRSALICFDTAYSAWTDGECRADLVGTIDDAFMVFAEPPPQDS